MFKNSVVFCFGLGAVAKFVFSSSITANSAHPYPAAKEGVTRKRARNGFESAIVRDILRIALPKCSIIVAIWSAYTRVSRSCLVPSLGLSPLFPREVVSTCLLRKVSLGVLR